MVAPEGIDSSGGQQPMMKAARAGDQWAQTALEDAVAPFALPA
jgi:hypothetical protein